MADMKSLVESVETIESDQKDAGAAVWTVAITADDANGVLAVTEPAGANIRWHVVVQSRKVVYREV